MAQMQPEKEEEELRTKAEETPEEEIQASPNGKTAVPSYTENKLKSSKGGGNKMDDATRNEMEMGFGADFSQVNIHIGSQAVQMNKELGAQAFTHGNDIYFNEGKYNPYSNEGKHLLAHELTHTIQHDD
jgi:dihydroxyacetone kinase-like predicted kinase